MRVFRNRYLASALLLLTMVVFAAQGASFGGVSQNGGPLLVPLAALASASGAVIAGQAFAGKPLSAGLIAAGAVAAFLYGEAYFDTALEVMFGGPMAWWSEAVAALVLIVAAPATLTAGIGAFLLARWFGKATS